MFLGPVWRFTLREFGQDLFIFLFDLFYARLVDFAAAMAIAVFEPNDLIDNLQIFLIVNDPLGR